MLGFGKTTDPVCGMKVEKKSSIAAHGKYFCSQACVDTFVADREKAKKEVKKGGCCCH